MASSIIQIIVEFADPSAVSALHAPTSKPWVGEQEYYFLGELYPPLQLAILALESSFVGALQVALKPITGRIRVSTTLPMCTMVTSLTSGPLSGVE